MDRISAQEARRIALASQGLGAPRKNGQRVTTPQLRKVIDRTKLLQIDSVNVLVRSHYLPLFSRLGGYSTKLLDDMAYEKRDLTEYWGRQASFIPTQMWPLFRPRMERPHHRFAAWADANSKYIDSVYKRLKDNGPMSAGDFEGERDKRGPWWDWREAKAALEWMFLIGRVAVSHRRNFERHYDLAERVVPLKFFKQRLSREDAQRKLIAESAHALGIGTVKDIGGYFGMSVKDAQARIGELVDEGDLVPVRVEGWRQPAYMHKGAKPGTTEGVSALLTPFDPLIWERDRTERLFDFYYRIEIYVPAPKRIHGYYVLPFLMDDGLVARVDLKADRQASALLVQGAFAELRRDKKAVAARLGAELRTMAGWLGLESVVVRRNGDLAAALTKEVSSRR